MPEAFVTLATTDEYCLGALNWAMSLKRSGTSRDIVIMITDTVTDAMRNVLNEVFSDVIVVDVLDSRDHINLGLLDRPDLGVTFTKLHCWRLVKYSKAVFMDADTLVLQNIDDLFEREEFSAAPDPGWPDCFNSGVFVYVPNVDTYSALIKFALEVGSFDGGDQGLLNLYFSNWSTEDIKKHLPFTYNCVSQTFYSYLPAFNHFRRNIKVIHFIGALKPWHCHFNPETGKIIVPDGSGFATDHITKWWSIFICDTKPHLSSTLTGLCGEMASMDVSTFDNEYGGESGWKPGSHKEAWEHGIIDYRGLDRFDNIQAHLDSKLSGKKK